MIKKYQNVKITKFHRLELGWGEWGIIFKAVQVQDQMLPSELEESFWSHLVQPLYFAGGSGAVLPAAGGGSLCLHAVRGQGGGGWSLNDLQITLIGQSWFVRRLSLHLSRIITSLMKKWALSPHAHALGGSWHLPGLCPSQMLPDPQKSTNSFFSDSKRFMSSPVGAPSLWMGRCSEGMFLHWSWLRVLFKFDALLKWIFDFPWTHTSFLPPRAVRTGLQWRNTLHSSHTGSGLNLTCAGQKASQ